MNHSVLEQSLDDKFCGNSAVPPAVDRFYGKSWVRGLLILSGTVAAGLGMIAVVVPLLPTTPFLLLASACYVRSSQPLYNRLLNNRWTGEYIRNFREGRGMPLRAKVVSIALLWVSLGLLRLHGTDFSSPGYPDAGCGGCSSFDSLNPHPQAVMPL